MKRGNSSHSRRSFIRTTAAGTLGAGLAWKFGGTLALGQIPWESKWDTIKMDETSDVNLSAMYKISGDVKNESPCIAFDSNGKLWVAWVSERENGEQIYLTSFENGEWGKEVLLSESEGMASDPQMIAVRDGIVVGWVEKRKAGWSLLIRQVNQGQPGRIQTVCASEEINWKPAMTVDPEGQIWVTWERKPKDRFEIWAARIEGKRMIVPFLIHREENADCCRPAIVCDRKGQIWISWDQGAGPGNQDVYLCSCEGSEPGKPIQVTSHPAADLASALSVDPENRLWIAWHSNRKGDAEWDIPRWFQLCCFHKGKFYEPAGEPTAKNLDKEGTDQSFEFVRLFCGEDGKVFITGRASHNFFVQYYQGSKWSPLYRLPVDGWGGRGQFLQGAFDSKGDLWVVRRDIGSNVLQQIAGLKGPSMKPDLKSIQKKISQTPQLVNIHRKPDTWEPLKDLEGIREPLNFYYGDIHGHTWTSDGVGDVDEYYWTRRDYYQDDFASLTDHDNFIANGLLPSEWERIKQITRHFNEDGRFVTFYGQEWTTARPPRGFGHKNIYHTDIDIPLYDHTDSESKDVHQLYAECKKWGAIAIPHHIGWTGVDWENHDEEIVPVVEIVSNHGVFEYQGNRPIPHRGGMRGCFVQDGLARGLKFGLIGSSDSHGLIWHHRVAYKRDCNRTGLACVLAPDLSQKSLFEAMKKRRTFASTGVKCRLDFRADNHLMGEAFETKESKVALRVNLSAQLDLKWLTIVKNNKDWFQYGGENYESRFSVTDDQLEPGESYYYLRVEFEPEGMAWSSPIWVNRTA